MESLSTGQSIDRTRLLPRSGIGVEAPWLVIAPPGTIPHTTSGKIRRAETRARFQAGTLLTGGERLN